MQKVEIGKIDEKHIPLFNHDDDGEEFDTDYLLMGWEEYPLGGMNDLLGIFDTVDQARDQAKTLAGSLLLIEYQIVEGDSLDIIEEGTAKDLVPSVIN